MVAFERRLHIGDGALQTGGGALADAAAAKSRVTTVGIFILKRQRTIDFACQGSAKKLADHYTKVKYYYT